MREWLRVSGRGQLERHRDTIDAVAKPCRLWPVVEHVPQVSAAAPAVNRGAYRSERRVTTRADGIRQRRPEARPAGAALEPGRRRKQVEAAARASEIAGTFLVQERARVGALRRAFPQHRILV